MARSYRILLTAFEPFGAWSTNASRICLEHLLPQIPTLCEVVAKIYPVEFTATRPILEADLGENFDLAIHLGQAQQTGRIRLEAVGLNVGTLPGRLEGETFALIADGPPAYQVDLPLSVWAEQLRSEGYPAYVSHHAGTYLCNATLYWGRHFIERHGLKTQTCFVHVPLDISQVAGLPGDYLTLPSMIVAQGVARIINLWMTAALQSPPESTVSLS